jgi:hypothetical protein
MCCWHTLLQVAQQLRSDIDARAAEMERSAPNLKALEQYEAVKAQEKEQAGCRTARQCVHVLTPHMGGGIMQSVASVA